MRRLRGWSVRCGLHEFLAYVLAGRLASLFLLAADACPDALHLR